VKNVLYSASWRTLRRLAKALWRGFPISPTNCPRREYLKREVFNSKKEERDSVKVFVEREFTKKGKFKSPRKTGGQPWLNFRILAVAT